MASDNFVGSRSALILTFIALAASCKGPSQEGSDIGLQQAELGVEGGTVPWPVDPDTGNVNWDRSHAELLAADALAACWSGQPATRTSGGTSARDHMLQQLSRNMESSLCVTSSTGDNAADALYNNWIASRSNESCNVVPGTSDAAALSFDGAASRNADAYLLPDASTTQGDPLYFEGSVSSGHAAAQDLLLYADLSLCMASRMSAHLDSAQVAYASAQELERLLALIQERTLTAVHSYSAILKSFTAKYVSRHLDAGQGVKVLHYWGNEHASDATLTSLGQDYAYAVELLVEATQRIAETLQRAPDAATRYGSASGEGFRWTSARAEMVFALYGFHAYDALEPRLVLTSMDDPQIATLLSFARSADAFEIPATGISDERYEIDISATADELLRATETWLRQQECERTNDTSPDCSTVAADADPSSFLLAERYLVRPSHATKLTRALVELAFGPPHERGATNHHWRYPAERYPGSSAPDIASAAGLFTRLRGNHTKESSISAASYTDDLVYHIAPDFTPSPLQPNELQWANGHNELLPLYLHGDTPNMGTQLADLSRNPHIFWQPDKKDYSLRHSLPRRLTGTVPILAVARETLVQTNASSSAAFTAARVSLPLIDAAIGNRTTVLRKQPNRSCSTVDCESGGVSLFQTHTPEETCLSDSAQDCTLFYDVSVTSGSDDTADALVSAAPASAVVPTDADTLSAASPTTPATIESSETGKTIRTYSVSYDRTDEDSDQTQFELYLHDSTNGTHELLFLPNMNRAEDLADSYRQRQDIDDSIFRLTLYVADTTAAHVITRGGFLNHRFERAFAFKQSDWSTPRFDPFGLPTDWNPTADASLHGGAKRQPTYQYFLQKARTAAAEATTAISTSIKNTIQQSVDRLELEQSQDRASQLTRIEREGVCGKAPAAVCGGPSKLPIRNTTISLPASSGQYSDADFFSSAYESLDERVGGSSIALPAAVLDEIDSGNADFSTYDGGTLKELFLQISSTHRSLHDAIESALQDFRAKQAAINEAKKNEEAADAEKDSADANYLQAMQRFSANQKEARQRAEEFEARAIALEGQWHNMVRDDEGCASRPSMWDDTDQLMAFCVHDEPTEGVIRQSDAYYEWSSLIEENLGVFAGIDAVVRASTEVTSATSQHFVAEAREKRTREEAGASIYHHTNKISGVIEKLESLTAKAQRVYESAASAAARLQIESNITEAKIQERFSHRRRYRSYDLWRARALSKSARRLATAARRAIESRYVVNLSDMRSPEPFVEAPYVWADEIYSSDLKPPAALGRAARSGQNTDADGAIYANKLSDYVRNLELFVNGYAVERPISTVARDNSVLQFVGPVAQSTVSTGNDILTYTSPQSLGWTFYCDQESGWTTHPDAQLFGDGIASLSEVCDGRAPSRAKLSFRLGPWGKTGEYFGSKTYRQRHNVRWERLAVNLVGSGIRDCTKAPDPSSCYANGFVQFQLRHVGPSWVTNYDREWRSMELPTAYVEAGKALATEEWLDPISNNFQRPVVQSVGRSEFAGRPMGGTYELLIEITPDLRLGRIEHVQILTEMAYWVRQEVDEQHRRASNGRVCGNGVVDEGELCDGDCPTSCPESSNACSNVVLQGDPLLCNVECVEQPITECIDNDGCCGSNCTSLNDMDCNPVCGNGVLEAGEACDPGEETADCNADCTYAVCGDGVTNFAAGETCDSNCPDTCDDYDNCTTDALTGDVASCTATCDFTPVTACIGGDGCCLPGCDEYNDSDCAPGAPLLSFNEGTFTRASSLESDNTHDATYVDAVEDGSGGCSERVRMSTPDERRWGRLCSMSGESAALLFEGERENRLQWSHQLDGTGWGNQSNSSATNTALVIPDTHVAPNGELQADTVEDNGDQNVYEDGQSIRRNFGLEAGVHTESFWIKKTDTNHVITAQFRGAGVSPYYTVRFDTATGDSRVMANTPERVRAHDYGEWWRFSITAQMNEGWGEFWLFPATATTLEADTDRSLTGSVVVWGVQVEPGRFPSQYIPTAGSSVTRAADKLVFGALPAQMRDSRWAVDVYPTFSSDDVSFVTGDGATYSLFGNAQHMAHIGYQGGAPRIRVGYDGGSNWLGWGVGWERSERIQFVFDLTDASNETVTVTVGDDSPLETLALPVALDPERTFVFGARGNESTDAPRGFARISEPYLVE